MNYKHLNSIYPTVIKIDIDTPYLSWFTVNSLKLFSQYFTFKKLIIKRSPSKKGYHIIICIAEKLTDAEIIALQFAFGSDKKRERYNLLRYINGNPMKEWNLLFSIPKSKIKKLRWLIK